MRLLVTSRVQCSDCPDFHHSLFIEFEPHEKALILQHAGVVCPEAIAKELRDGRYRHIEFTIDDLVLVGQREASHRALPGILEQYTLFLCAFAPL